MRKMKASNGNEPISPQWEMNNEEVHEEGGSKDSVLGYIYQLNMLMLACYRAYIKELTFRLATEMKDADKLGDIVLEYRNKEGQTKNTFMQCKHKKDEQTLITTNILKCNKHFKVQTYFDAYKKMYEDKKFANDSIEHLILFTNANIDENLKTDGEIVEVELDEELGEILRFNDFKKMNTSVPKYYKFNDIFSFIKPGTNHDENTLKQYFEARFLLAVNQPNEIELHKIIRAEIDENFKIADSQQFVMQLRHSIYEWMTKKVGAYLTNEFFQGEMNKTQKLGSIFENPEKRLEYGNFFKSTTYFQKMLKAVSHTLLRIESSGSSLTLIKNIQTLKDNNVKFVALTLNRLLTLENVFQATFSSSSELTIVIECELLNNERIYAAKKALNTLLTMCENHEICAKTVILISHDRNDQILSLINGKLCELIEDKCTYDDLTKETQERILNYDITFQGYKIKLKEIVGENCAEILGEHLLNKIIDKEEIRIGKPLRSLNDTNSYYISRKLISNTEAKSKIKVIEGGPGIGKSTELTNMALTEKQKNNNFFVIRLNLLDHVKELNDVGDNILINMLIESGNIKTEFEKSLLIDNLSKFTGQLSVYFDGFDEVSPFCDAKVVNLLKLLQKEAKVRKIWVTTRPHAKHILQEESELTFSCYDLLPFDEKNQKEFLQKYWNHSLGLNPNGNQHIEIFADKLLRSINSSDLKNASELIGIPLQARMIAEIFEEKCASFLRSEGKLEIELAAAHMNVYDLFKEFIKKKFNVYFTEKLKLVLENIHAQCVISTETKPYRKQIQKLACKIIFPDKYDIFWKPNVVENQNELFEVGIVQKRNDNLAFIHRTFAEYFLAELLYDKLQQPTNNNMVLIEFLRFNYFQERNGMIRYFLDHFLANNSEVHKAVLKNDLEKVKALVNNDQSHLFAKDSMGRIPLHLSCVYSKFELSKEKELLYPVNNVIQFLLNKDLEKNNPSQIVIQDILNYTPYAYSVISMNFRQIRPFLDWNYSEHILDHNLNFNNLKQQYDRLIIINNWFAFDDVLYDVGTTFKKENISLNHISENEGDFRAIKPYFYHAKNSTEKVAMCKENNYQLLKTAVRSYFIDVVCFGITKEKYFNQFDHELGNLQLCHDIFSEAIKARDFLLLLGITLTCPKTAMKQWMEVNYLDFLRNTSNEVNEVLQKTNAPLSNKNDFFSKNYLRNYLVLALRQLLIHNRIDSPVAMIDVFAYFKKVLMDDFLSFDVSLKLVNEAEKFEIHERAYNTLLMEKNVRITEINSNNVSNAFKYIKHHGFNKWKDIETAINFNKEAAIKYFRDCFSKNDIIGTNYLLMYALHHFDPSRRCQELGNILRDIHMNYKTWAYFIKPDALPEKIQNKLCQSMDQYLGAVSRGYPLSVTLHIISQITWLNSDDIPPFIEVYFKDQNTRNFADEVLKEVRKGNVKDLLRYFIFANEEDVRALLRENKFEIIKYCLSFKNKGISFMSDERTNNVLKYDEYGVCLLNAVEMQDLAQLYFLNLFFKSESEVIFEETADLSLVLANALKQMDHKWIKKLFYQLKSMQIETFYREGLRLYLPRGFSEDLKVFNLIITELQERDEYLDKTMYVEAFKNAVINKDYEKLDGLHYIGLYKWEWIKSMKENVEIANYMNYFKYFCKNEQIDGLKAIMKYKSDEDKTAIEFFFKHHGVEINCHEIADQTLSATEWQNLAKLLEKYESGTAKGLHCPIMQFVHYSLVHIKKSVEMPNCVKLYLGEPENENPVNYLDEVFKEHNKGNCVELVMWYQSVPGEKKRHILEDAFRRDYIATILDNIPIADDTLNEVVLLSDYNNCVSVAINESNFKKLGQLTKCLSNEQKVTLWEKMDYKTAFINALKAKEHQWVIDFVKQLKSKHEELLQLNDFMKYINEVSNNNNCVFERLINKIRNPVKDRILNEIKCTAATINPSIEKDDK